MDSLNRLGQHLNGLRSGIAVQYELVKASRDGRLKLRNQSSIRASRNGRGSSIATPGSGSGKGKLVNFNGIEAAADSVADDDSALLQAAADAFGDLIEDLGPPLKALSVGPLYIRPQRSD